MAPHTLACLKLHRRSTPFRTQIRAKLTGLPAEIVITLDSSACWGLQGLVLTWNGSSYLLFPPLPGSSALLTTIILLPL